jgi:hypothetical protein
MTAEQRLEALAKQTNDSLSSKALLGAVLSEWGGIAEFAAELRRDFQDLPPGHPSRVKIQTLLVQSLLKLGQSGEVDEMEEDLLEETQRQIMAQLQEEEGNGRA